MLNPSSSMKSRFLNLCLALASLVSAHARGLGTCAKGALATWKSPILEEFGDVPKDYKLVCGVSMGYPTDHVINNFNPGRRDVNGISF
jgi:nitroreductase